MIGKTKKKFGNKETYIDQHYEKTRSRKFMFF